MDWHRPRIAALSRAGVHHLAIETIPAMVSTCDLIFHETQKPLNILVLKIIFIIIYLQSEFVEKYQFELCSKYDREHDFDTIYTRVS